MENMADDASPPVSSSLTTQSSRGRKRKVDVSNSPANEPKRARYVSTACDECKRRKIRCNGYSPCRRCRNLSLTCIYTPRNESVSKELGNTQQLNETIGALRKELESVKAELAELQNIRQRRQSQHAASSRDPLAHVKKSPSHDLDPARDRQHEIEQFQGPTTSFYGFKVANSSLRIMGIDRDPVEDDEQGTQSHSTKSDVERVAPLEVEDPIWSLSLAEALHLAQLYEEECSILYPIADMDSVREHINWLYESSSRGPDTTDHEFMRKDLTETTKLIIAIGFIVDGDGKRETAQRLFESIEPMIHAKITRAPRLQSLVLLVLTATFLFHSDEESQALRLINISARLSYEMGLHRRDTLMRNFGQSPQDSRHAVQCFWIIYALDRRWSFGTGMPFAIQDADIDPLLPEPDDKNLYLKHVTRCNKIMSKVWSLNVSYDTRESQITEIDFLDYQIQRWYSELPDCLKYDRNNAAGAHPGISLKLRVLTSLRANLAIIQIYRPILHSATSTLLHISRAQRIVSVAKETINLLVHVNDTSTLYRRQPVTYSYFLVQALAVIFLASSYAPAEFLSQTRNEFYAALSLIKGFSEKSNISKRLRATIRDLKQLREKIGAVGYSSRPREEPSSTTPDASLAILPSPSTSTSTVEVGQHMSSDLVRLYERLGQGQHATVAPQPADLVHRDSGIEEDQYSGLAGHDIEGHRRKVDSSVQNMYSCIWGELL